MADLVKFVHNGCFTARFVATWDEIRIDEEGNKQPTIKSYYSDSVDNNYTYTVTSTSKVSNLCVNIESCTGLAWDMWKRVCDARDIPTNVCTTFTTSGTVLNPKVTINPPIEHASRYIL